MSKPQAEFTERVEAAGEIIQQIDSLEEIQAIFELARSRWDQLQSARQQQFKIGDHIEWTVDGRGRNAGFHQGVVTGFKGNNITAVTLRGVHWTLAPSAVRHSIVEG